MLRVGAGWSQASRWGLVVEAVLQGVGGVLAALRVPLLLDGWWWFTGGRGAVVSWFTPG